MTKRESRVINAFCNCVRNGEFTEDYAITRIEDNQRYGWLSNEAKDAFYAFLDEWEKEQKKAAAPEVEYVGGSEEPEEEAPAEEPAAEETEAPEETGNTEETAEGEGE